MSLTKYAEHLLAKHVDAPPKFWLLPLGNRFITVELVNRNAYGYCLVKYPDGEIRQMKWSELQRVGNPKLI